MDDIDNEPAWCVLIEQDHGAPYPRVIQHDSPPELFAGYDEACREAERLAFSYDPPEPKIKKSRHVYKVSDREWVAVVQGATTSFHLVVRVAERVTASPEGGWDGNYPGELLAAEEELRRS